MRLKALWASLVVLLTWGSAASAQTKVAGTVVCAKPDQQQMLEVGDHAGHMIGVSQGKCTWSKPLEVGGTQTKEDLVTLSLESHGAKGSSHGYVVGSMANADNVFIRVHGGATFKEGAVDSSEGKWTYTGGTGTLKGIKGEGTYKCKASTEGSSCEVEGEYQLAGK